MSDDSQPLALICGSCGQQNPKSKEFCEACGGPIGQYTTVDPLKRIYAQGALYRKISRSSVKPIVKIGAFLLFGMPILVGLIGAYRMIFKEDVVSSQWSQSWPELAIVIGVIAISALLYYSVLRKRRND